MKPDNHSDQLLHLFLESVTDYAIFIMDLEGRVTAWNTGAERQLGYKEQEILGQPGAIIFTPEDRQNKVPEQEIAGAKEAGRALDERWHVRKDGSRFWASGAMTLLRDDEGRPRGFAKILRDLTDRKHAHDALEISQANLAKAQEIAHLGSWELDLHNLEDISENELRWSDEVYRLLGYTPGKVKASNELFFRSVHPDDRARIQEAVARSLSDKSPYDLVHRIVRPDGVERWMHEKSEIVYDHTGRALKMVGTVQDITDRHRAELALQATQVRFRTLFDSIDEGFCVVELLFDPEGKAADYRFLEVNPAFESQTGLRDSVGRTRRELVPAEEEDWFQIYGEVAKTGKPVRFEKAAQALGRVFDVYAFRVGEAGQDRVAILLTDISDRKRIEKKVRESEQRLRRAVEIDTVGVIFFNPEGPITEANDAFLRMSGYTREDLATSRIHWDVLTPPEWMPVSLKAVEQFKTLGHTTPYQKEYLRKDGTRWWGLFAATRLCETEGVEYIIDITAQKQADEELRRRREELGQLNETLEKRVAERTRELQESREALLQAQKLEAIGRLAGGVAHDFNNLVTGMLGMAEDIRDQSPNPTITQDAEQIITAARRAFGVTRQLLAFARRQVIQPEMLDVNVVIKDVRNFLQRLIGEDIAIYLELQEVPIIKVDRSHLEQIVINLAVNARDAMANGGLLSFRTGVEELKSLPRPGYLGLEAGRYVVIEVADNGSGMTPEVIKHIYEPFFTTKDPDKGTGLGLSTVYGIVKQSGGSIKVISEQEKGTTFRVYFPAAHESRAHPRVPNSPQGSLQGRETILVIEDDDIVRKVVTKKLRRHGYQVLEAPHGLKAIELLRSRTEPVDLIITDVIMPQMNGREAVTRLKDLAPNAAVLYMSGYPAEVIAKQGVIEPGIAFIEKAEISGTGLLERVRTELARRGAPSAF